MATGTENAKCPKASKFSPGPSIPTFELVIRANYLAPFRFLGMWNMLANSSKRKQVVPSAFYVNYIVSNCQTVSGAANTNQHGSNRTTSSRITISPHPPLSMYIDAVDFNPLTCSFSRTYQVLP